MFSVRLLKIVLSFMAMLPLCAITAEKVSLSAPFNVDKATEITSQNIVTQAGDCSRIVRFAKMVRCVLLISASPVHKVRNSKAVKSPARNPVLCAHLASLVQPSPMALDRYAG